MPERSFAEVLAALPAGDRTRVEQRLSRASLAVYQARQALSEAQASETPLAAWRAYLREAREALAAAAAIVAPDTAESPPAP